MVILFATSHLAFVGIFCNTQLGLVIRMHCTCEVICAHDFLIHLQDYFCLLFLPAVVACYGGGTTNFLWT